MVTELSKAFALSAASDEAAAIRDDVKLFQAIQAALSKKAGVRGKSPSRWMRRYVSSSRKRSSADGEVIDVFTAAGLKNPDIGISDDRFLAEVRGLKIGTWRELLEKLLKDELKVRAKHNLVQSQLFSEKLSKTLNAYHNRAISTMEVIEELIPLGEGSAGGGNREGLTNDEWAFYDALATSDRREGRDGG